MNKFMIYQVLARKWRPQIFTDVVGQEHVLKILANSLSLGRIHHAYLLSGTRGVGKTTIARLLAKGLNCKIGITANPCGLCSHCQEIERCCFVDLIEVDAASRTKVEDTRDLLENIQYAPIYGRFKVYLIDEVHMLSRHSFNALLKTLEEPPQHVKFLLATTDPQKLPVTILSRCLQLHLKALHINQIRDQLSLILQKEEIIAESHAIQLIASAANGSMRDALSLTDQAIAMGLGRVGVEEVSLMLGTINTEQPLSIIEALAVADGNEIMAQIAQCAARNIDWESLLIEMLTLLHRISMNQLIPDQLNEEQDTGIIPRLQNLAQRLLPADLQLYYQVLLTGRKELPFSPNPRMGVEMTLLRALGLHSAKVKQGDISSKISAEKKTDKFNVNIKKDNHLMCLPITPSTLSLSTSIEFSCDTKSKQDVAISINKLFIPNNAMEVKINTAKLIPKQLLIKNIRSTSKEAIAITQAIPTPFLLSPNERHAHQNCTRTKEERLPQYSSATELLMPETKPIVDNNHNTHGLLTSKSLTNTEILSTQIYITNGLNNKVTQKNNAQKKALISDNITQEKLSSPSNKDYTLSLNMTSQLLQAREVLLQYKEKITNNKQVIVCKKKASLNPLERLTILGNNTQQHKTSVNLQEQAITPRQKVCHCNLNQLLDDNTSKTVITPRVLYTTLNHEKIPGLELCLTKESIITDPWTKQVNRLVMPKIVRQLAFNSWKEEISPGKICLHLRASHRHLNSLTAKNILRAVLSVDMNMSIKLTIKEDDNIKIKTPLEWYQAIYKEMFTQAKIVILNDPHIQMLQSLFDAELDENNIIPI